MKAIHISARALAVYLLGVAIPSIYSPALAADYEAYISYPTTSSSITTFHPSSGKLGPSFFGPAAYTASIFIRPGTQEVWESVTPNPGSPFIAILDPSNGATLATISFPPTFPGTSYAGAVVFDRSGKVAYFYDGTHLAKINAANRTVIGTRNVGKYSYASSAGIAISSDGSKLFLLANATALPVVDTQTLTIIATIPAVGDLFVSGTTLFVAGETGLLYFDTSSYQQTNSAPLPADSFNNVFGVSPDGSTIYVETLPYNLSLPGSVEALDFASGQTLLSQTIDSLSMPDSVSLSPDGTQIVVATAPLTFLDAGTLATISTEYLSPAYAPSTVAYVGPDTVIVLNINSSAVAVVDSSTASVTATFPSAPGAGVEVPNPETGVIYMANAVISAKLNQVAEVLPYSLTQDEPPVPNALVGHRLYGGFTEYDLATQTSTQLPVPPFIPGSGLVVLENGPGAAPPSGKTYWLPLEFEPSSGGDVRTGSKVPSGIAVYNTAKNTLISWISVPLVWSGAPNATNYVVAFSPDSTTAYVLVNKGIALYSTQTLQNTASWTYSTSFVAIAPSPDGSVIYATDGNGVYVLSAATGAIEQVFDLPVQAPTANMALSQDGSTLFLTDVGSFDNSAVDIINTATGEITTVPAPFASGIAVLPAN